MNPWEELDQMALNSRRANAQIWAEEYESDVDALKAFRQRAEELAASYTEEAAKQHFDNQFSQLVRRYMDYRTCSECGELKHRDYECCVYCEVCGVHYSEDDACPWH